MVTKKPVIIPIASGKGGVGKTFFTANLAIALSQKGHRTIAVDLDLGGSNLHTFLGLPNKFPGVGDFLKARQTELADLVTSTSFANLQFLAGDGRTPFMANIAHAQKIRLVSRLGKLPAEYILLDLGAGTTYNTLDFFGLSPHGILVTTPEYPAILSMLAFLKQFMLRTIERHLVGDNEIKSYLQAFYKQPLDEQQNSIVAVKSQIAKIDPDAGAYISALCEKFRPRVIFNHGDDPAEIEIADKIDQSLANVLSIKADYFGFIFNDPTVRQAVKSNRSFMHYRPEGLTAQIIGRIAERIIRYWDTPIKNSAALVTSNTEKLQQQHPF
jgi:flagellar biosynthesis protein FlhG